MFPLCPWPLYTYPTFTFTCPSTVAVRCTVISHFSHTSTSLLSPSLPSNPKRSQRPLRYVKSFLRHGSFIQDELATGVIVVVSNPSVLLLACPFSYPLSATSFASCFSSRGTRLTFYVLRLVTAMWMVWESGEDPFAFVAKAVQTASDEDDAKGLMHTALQACFEPLRVSVLK